MPTLAANDPIRQALGRLGYGLYFLTLGAPAAPQGLLVSWVSQVSGDPPLVLAAVRHNRSLAPALSPGAGFALNLLPAGDRQLLASLARPAQDRFTGLELSPGPLDLPVLAGGLGAGQAPRSFPCVALSAKCRILAHVGNRHFAFVCVSQFTCRRDST